MPATPLLRRRLCARIVSYGYGYRKYREDLYQGSLKIPDTPPEASAHASSRSRVSLSRTHIKTFYKYLQGAKSDDDAPSRGTEDSFQISVTRRLPRNKPSYCGEPRQGSELAQMGIRRPAFWHGAAVETYIQGASPSSLPRL